MVWFLTWNWKGEKSHTGSIVDWTGWLKVEKEDVLDHPNYKYIKNRYHTSENIIYIFTKHLQFRGIFK